MCRVRKTEVVRGDLTEHETLRRDWQEKTAGALGVPGRGEVRDHSPSTASLRAPRSEHSSEFGHSEDGRTGAEEPGGGWEESRADRHREGQKLQGLWRPLD